VTAVDDGFFQKELREPAFLSVVARIWLMMLGGHALGRLFNAQTGRRAAPQNDP